MSTSCKSFAFSIFTPLASVMMSLSLDTGLFRRAVSGITLSISAGAVGSRKLNAHHAVDRRNRTPRDADHAERNRVVGHAGRGHPLAYGKRVGCSKR